MTSTRCSEWSATVEVITRSNPLRTAATVTYVHTDGLRSPVAETDASGAVTTRIRHEPYGAVYATTGAGQTGAFLNACAGCPPTPPAGTATCA